MAINYYAEVTREKPAAKNKANTKIRYNVRVYKNNDGVINQLGSVGLFGNLDKFAAVVLDPVKDLSYGKIVATSETGSHGTGAKFYVDITPETSGYYTPGFRVDIREPDIVESHVIGTTDSKARTDDPSLFEVVFASPTGTPVSIPTIQVTKAEVAPDMPTMLKGINRDTDQSGLDSTCGGFQYDSCRKRWITIWKRHRYVHPKTHKVATNAQAKIIDEGGTGAPTGYNKQYGYEIEGILDSVARDPANAGKTFAQMRTAGKTLRNLNVKSLGKWDWASNNTPYDPPGTGTSLGSWKSATETAFKAFINGNCAELPTQDNNNSATTPDTPIDLDKLIARFNPPPHITTRHFSPIADPERKVFE